MKGVCVFAGMMQAQMQARLSTEIVPYSKALSDSRLYPESAFHKFININ
jgi:hypothetical protein